MTHIYILDRDPKHGRMADSYARVKTLRNVNSWSLERASLKKGTKRIETAFEIAKK